MKHRLASKVVETILDDLKGRSGLGDVWDQIDPATQYEITSAWKEMVEKHLGGDGSAAT